MSKEKWLRQVVLYLEELGYHNAARSLKDINSVSATGWISNCYPRDPKKVVEDFDIKAKLPEHKEHSICGYS